MQDHDRTVAYSNTGVVSGEFPGCEFQGPKHAQQPRCGTAMASFHETWIAFFVGVVRDVAPSESSSMRFCIAASCLRSDVMSERAVTTRQG